VRNAPRAEKPTAKQKSARTSCFKKTSSLGEGASVVDLEAEVIGGVKAMGTSESGVRGVLRELEIRVRIGMGRMEVKRGR